MRVTLQSLREFAEQAEDLHGRILAQIMPIQNLRREFRDDFSSDSFVISITDLQTRRPYAKTRHQPTNGNA